MVSIFLKQTPLPLLSALFDRVPLTSTAANRVALASEAFVTVRDH